MSAAAERRGQDLAKLETLAQQSSGRIKVLSKKGQPLREVVVELAYRTAPSTGYPGRVQDHTRVKIELSDRYPFQEPTAVIITPILHPNVFTSGRICLGQRWLPTENLALLVRRIALIITFDPTVLNEVSPANAHALSWYRSASSRHPGAFPTDRVSIAESVPTAPKRIEWKEVTDKAPPSARVEILCPQCGSRLRVPAGRQGNVKCSICASIFMVKS